MPPKVLFVIPPCFLDRDLDFEVGFPVNLALLGCEARRLGWQVEYLDMMLEEKEGYDSFADLERRLGDGSLSLAGISNHTVRTSITTRAVAERVKAVRPDVKIVVGGVNSTFMWRELMNWCPAIDYVLRGYAQPGLRALLASLEFGGTPAGPGLVSRHCGELHSEPMSSVVPSDFATPSLQGLDVSRYLDWTKTYSLVTHTGCDFSCNFCTSVMPGPYQNREVHRPVDDVIAEMRQAIDLGFERFFMSANTFTSRRERCIELCKALQRAGIPDAVTWVCMTRVEYVDAELLVAMRGAGCINIAFGVEMASPDQWKGLRKGRFSEDTIRKAFHLTKEAGIGTTAYLMLGAPAQTAADIEATISLVRDIDPGYRVVSFFQPFPGTPYWEHPERFGLFDIAPLEEWNFHEAPICATKHMGKRFLWNATAQLHLCGHDSVRGGITVDHPADVSAGAEGCRSSSVCTSPVSAETSVGELPVASRRRRLLALYHLRSVHGSESSPRQLPDHSPAALG